MRKGGISRRNPKIQKDFIQCYREGSLKRIFGKPGEEKGEGRESV